MREVFFCGVQKVLPASLSECVDVDIESAAGCGHHGEGQGLVLRGLPADVQGLSHCVEICFSLQGRQGRRQFLRVVLTPVEVTEFGVPLVLDGFALPDD